MYPKALTRYIFSLNSLFSKQRLVLGHINLYSICNFCLKIKNTASPD